MLSLPKRLPGIFLRGGEFLRLLRFQPAYNLPQLLMQRRKRVVTKRDSYSELAIEILRNLAAGLSQARQRRKRGWFQESKIDEYR